MCGHTLKGQRGCVKSRFYRKNTFKLTQLARPEGAEAHSPGQRPGLCAFGLSARLANNNPKLFANGVSLLTHPLLGFQPAKGQIRNLNVLLLSGEIALLFSIQLISKCLYSFHEYGACKGDFQFSPLDCPQTKLFRTAIIVFSIR